MATELGKAYVQIIPSAQGISGKISGLLKGEATSAGNQAGQITGSNLVGTLKKVIAVAGIGKALASSIKEGAALEQSLGGVEALFKENADKVVKNARQAYKTAGVSANEYMEGVNKFAASLLQATAGNTAQAADAADMAFRDMSDNSNRFGTNMQEIQNAYQGFAKKNYTMLDNLRLGYGGTKQEMERLLADAEKLTGVKYDINNLKDVYEAIHAVQVELGITGTTAQEAMSTLSGSFKAVKSAIKDALGSLALGENVRESFRNLAESASVFIFDNLIPMVMTAFESLPAGIAGFLEGMAPVFRDKAVELFSTFSEGFSNGFPGLFEKLKEITTGLGDWVKTQLPGMISNGTELIKSLGNGLIKGLPEIIKNAGEIVKGLVKAIVDALPEILKAGADIAVSLAKALIEHGPEILSAMGDLIKDLLKILIDGLPEFLKAGKEIGVKLIEAIKAKKDEVVNSLKDVIQAKIQAIKDKLGDFKSAATELAGNIKQGILDKKSELVQALTAILTEKIQAIQSTLGQFKTKGSELIAGFRDGLNQRKSDAVNAGREIANAVKEAIANFKGQFVSVGSNIISGIVQGIMNGIGAIASAAREAANRAVSAAKSTLGIRSPSRVFKDEVGAMISEGTAEGISNNLGLVESAISDMKHLTHVGVPELNYAPKAKVLGGSEDKNSLSDRTYPDGFWLNLALGGQHFKAFVDRISLEQGRAIDLELSY